MLVKIGGETPPKKGLVNMYIQESCNKQSPVNIVTFPNNEAIKNMLKHCENKTNTTFKMKDITENTVCNEGLLGLIIALLISYENTDNSVFYLLTSILLSI